MKECENDGILFGKKKDCFVTLTMTIYFPIPIPIFSYIFLYAYCFLRKHTNLVAFSLVVVFLYGGLFWGVFPEMYPNKNISWESHLMGTIVGFFIAVYFRKKGIQKEEYDWGNEYDVDEDQEDDSSITTTMDVFLKYEI